MTRLLETTNSRSTTHFPVVSLREIRLTRGAKPWLLTCINPKLKKFYLKHHQNWPMVLQNFKALFGKIILASSLLLLLKRLLWLSCKTNLRRTSVLSSNSYHYTSLKVWATIQMVFSDCPLIRTWKKRDSITYGLWKITVLLIELWSLSLLQAKKWVRLLTLCSVAIILLKL